MLDRRTLLKTLLISGISPNLLAKVTTEDFPDFFSAQGNRKSRYGFAFKKHHQTLKGLSQFRGHGATQHPTERHKVVLFARRPGTQAIEVNLLNGQIERRFSTEKNRHFFGHGVFSPDGQYLYTTEANLQTNLGVVVVRSAKDFTVLEEFSTFGIGPHELLYHPQQDTLVIANGGILTLPSSGRKKLNLDTMQSSLVYLNAHNGELIDKQLAPHEKSSMRHLSISETGEVALGIQQQRSAMQDERIIPLALTHSLGQAIKPLHAEENVWLSFRDYIGSVAINSQSNMAGFTSPHGDLAVFWDLTTRKLAGYYRLHDVCGLTTSPDNQHFILSNSFGSIRYLNATSLQENLTKRSKSVDTHWDNHLVNLTPLQGNHI